MSQASQTEDRSWVLAVLLAWAVPGLGHWYLGRHGKAAVFFVCVLGLFLAGWAMGQYKIVDSRDTLPFVAQILTGLVTLVANYVGVGLRAAGPAMPVSAMFQSGLVYTLVAGLLNLLVMLDAYIVANNIRRPTHPPEDEGAEAEEGRE